MPASAAGQVDWEEALLARWEGRQGQPMRWARLFFKVQDKVTGKTVPYVPMPNQERIDALTFARYNLLAGEGFDFSAWKARKGFVSSDIEYNWIALSMLNEGLVGLVVSDSDDTNKSVLAMWDLVYNTLPEPLFTVPAGARWRRPDGALVSFHKETLFHAPRAGLWNTEQRGFVFGVERVEANGQVTFRKRADSYTLFSSYKTTTFGRSFTPVFIHCLEYAHAGAEDAPKFNQALDGSRPAGRSARFNESTGNGPDTLHALDHKAWEAGESGLVGLVLYWYEDQTNRLSSDSSFVIRADQGDFPFTREELDVQALPEFPALRDSTLLHDMFRWRRYELRKARQNAHALGGGEEMGDAIFHQEHMERRADIYASPQAISPFSKEERQRLERGIRAPRGAPDGEFLAPRFRAWRFYPRASGHRYILTMDPSKTGATDPCVMKLFDAETDTEVVRFEGGVHPKLALEAALRVCREYAADQGFAEIWFVWERNTVGNDLRDYARELGFPVRQCYLDPKEEERKNAEPQYGWLNDPVSKGVMLRLLVLRVKEGYLHLSHERSVRDLLSYDFDANYRKTVEHTPDGVICDGLYAQHKDELCPLRTGPSAALLAATRQGGLVLARSAGHGAGGLWGRN